MTHVRPTTPEGAVLAIVALVADRPGRSRLVVDGAPASDPGGTADRVVTALSPRPALHVRSDRFWRPSSLRLENGRHNPDAWLDEWLDDDALRREVLDPFPRTGRVLPGLRDPGTDRSLRDAVVELPDNGIVVVSGSVLLGRGLPFDVVVHIRLRPETLVRLTPASDAWTLPALARYAERCDPESAADLVIRADDPRHPALASRS